MVFLQHIRWPYHASVFAWVWRWRSQVGWPLLALCLAVVLGAALSWVLQMPPGSHELAAQVERTRQLQGSLQALRSQAARMDSEPALPPPAQPASSVSQEAARPATAADGFAEDWHWHHRAMARGLQVQGLKPLVASGQQPARLQLKLRGRFHQHGDFAADLAQALRPMRLLSYQLRAGAEGLHEAELLLEFADLPLPQWPEVSGVARALQPVPAFPVGADPFSPPQPAHALADLPPPWRQELQRAKGVLEGEPLSAFELTGTLQRAGTWVALLRLQHMVHTVIEGDYLGPQLARVRRIDEQGLWLRELARDAQGRWSEQERHWRVGERP